MHAYTHLTHRRYAIRHECNVRERTENYKYGEFTLCGRVCMSQPVFFCFLFVFFSFFFCFRSFVSKRADAIPRPGKRNRRGTANGRREKGTTRRSEHKRRYLTNFTLTRAHAATLCRYHQRRREKDKQKSEKYSTCGAEMYARGYLQDKTKTSSHHVINLHKPVYVLYTCIYKNFNR